MHIHMHTRVHTHTRARAHAHTHTHARVHKHFFPVYGSFDYELTFGVSVMNMSKADRLIFGESLMTHAMVITGLQIEVGLLFCPCIHTYMME